jgi:lipopolysaccharide export system permease protein
MTIIDRMLFVAFLRAFIICLSSTLSLYMTVDSFSNIDSFASRSTGLISFLSNIAGYYMYRIFEYIDKLSEAITLLAAMFTISWMQRNNELLPLLSAGVSTHRVLRPILFGVLLLVGLSAVNQEFIIPTIASELTKDRDDPEGERKVAVQGVYDTSGIQIEGVYGVRKDLTIEYCYVTFPENFPGGMIHLSALMATYIPAGEGEFTGGWMLTGTKPRELSLEKKTELLTMIDPGKFFVRTKSVDFDAMIRNPKWIAYSSTEELNRMLEQSDGRRQNTIAVLFHQRLTRPILSVILVLLGLGILLKDQTRNMFISAGLCLIVCVLFYATIFACRFLGNADFVTPALSAWLPVLLFGPFAAVMFDAIHT